MQDWGSLALGCLRCTKTCFDSIYWWRCIILDGYHLPSIPISLIRCWNDIEGWDINLPTLRTLFWQPEWLQREFSRIDRSWWQEETVERIEALAAPNDSVADRMGIITGCWAKRLIIWEKGFSGWLRKLGVQSPKCPSIVFFWCIGIARSIWFESWSIWDGEISETPKRLGCWEGSYSWRWSKVPWDNHECRCLRLTFFICFIQSGSKIVLFEKVSGESSQNRWLGGEFSHTFPIWLTWKIEAGTDRRTFSSNRVETCWGCSVSRSTQSVDQPQPKKSEVAEQLTILRSGVGVREHVDTAGELKNLLKKACNLGFRKMLEIHPLS